MRVIAGRICRGVGDSSVGSATTRWRHNVVDESTRSAAIVGDVAQRRDDRERAHAPLLHARVAAVRLHRVDERLEAARARGRLLARDALAAHAQLLVDGRELRRGRRGEVCGSTGVVVVVVVVTIKAKSRLNSPTRR